MTKAQDFIKEFAPECSGNDLIPFSKVLALMESFKDAEFHEHFKNLHEIEQKTKLIIGNLIQPKPYPIESAILDAVINEDKMTLPYKVGDRFTNGVEILHANYYGSFLCKSHTFESEWFTTAELNQFTLIDNDLPHVEHTGI